MTDQPKAIISNRIYFKYKNNEHLKELMKALTYKIEIKKQAKAKFNNIEIIKNYKLLPQGIISVPQGRTDLIPDDCLVLDKRILHEVPFPTPKFDLREGQQVVYDEVQDTCFINALVGWGKTFVALHLARKLGQKTLVVTHTTMLRDQWIQEIRTLFGMEPGIIGSGKFDIEDHAIVVGNVQTITKHIPTLCKEFGTIILDEAHHCPATTFSAIVDGMYSRYRIALSGTMLRTDGKHVIFRDYFGSDVYRPPQSHTLDPVIKIVPTGISLPMGATWTQKINALLYDEEYQEFVAAAAVSQIRQGHKVLIVAERVDFLSRVKELIGEDCILITGEYPDTFEERKRLIDLVETGKASAIAGSKQIFSEGISVNILSCLILASPSANPITLEQLIGRIMRLHPDKVEAPLVIDMNFSSPSDRKQNAARLAFYTSKGWPVIKV
jgi:superfamily II DNA or RNA helicase